MMKHLLISGKPLGVPVLGGLVLALSAGATVAATTITLWGPWDIWSPPSIPAGLTNVTAIGAAAEFDIGARDPHCLALTATGDVVAWGGSWPALKAVPPEATNIVAIATGFSHDLALRADGRVFAWGLGSASAGRAKLDVPPDLTNAVAIAAGQEFSVALRQDGTVVAWGAPDYGQISVPPGLGDVRAIVAGRNHTLALKRDGTLVTWGVRQYGLAEIPAGLSEVIAIAAGQFHNLALRQDGTVVAWGRNASGETNVPSGLNGVVAIAAGFSHNLALRTNGVLVGWGTNNHGQASPPPGVSTANAFAIDANQDYSMMLSGEGTPSVAVLPAASTLYPGESVSFFAIASGRLPLRYQWFFGEEPIPGATKDFLDLTQVTLDQAGSYRVVVTNALGATASTQSVLTMVQGPPAVTIGSTNLVAYLYGSATFTAEVRGNHPLTYQWRFNGSDLPDATNVTLHLVSLEYGQAGVYSVLVSNALGTLESAGSRLAVVPVAVWGDYLRGQLDVPGDLTNVVALSAGRDHCLALRADGTLAAWGYNNYGQAVVPPWATNIVAISAGGYYNLVLTADGAVRWWGGYDYANQPDLPAGLSNVTLIAAGRLHSMALNGDGSVVAWGDDSRGQTNVPPGVSNVVGLACGYYHSLALRTDGSVLGWGDLSPEHTAFLASLSNVVEIMGGYTSTAALHEDGTVSVFGWSGVDPLVVRAETNQVATSALSYHCLTLSANGAVNAWGYIHYGYVATRTATVPADLRNAVAVAAGRGHSAGLISDGRPHVTRQPLGQYVYSGGTATFRPLAFGDEPLAWQWRRNGMDLPGATNAWLVLTNVQVPDAADYSVTVTNGRGSASSRATFLKVMESVPIFVRQPESQTIWTGTNTTFRVERTGSLPQTLQWQQDGVDLPGETNATLTTPNLPHPGSATYAVVAANEFGAVTSAVAVLTILMAPVEALNTVGLAWELAGNLAWFGQTNVARDGISALQSGPIGDGQQSIVQTTVRGPGTVSFWWKVSSENGADVLRFSRGALPLRTISGEVDWRPETFTIPAGDWTLRWMYIKSAGGSAGADAGWLDEVVYTPDGTAPVLTRQPQNATALGGETVTFNVAASGTAPLGYQWRKDAADLAGAVQDTLTLNNATRRDSGMYAVVVSNALGSVTSSNAVLVVRVPQLLRYPERQADGSCALTFGDADGGLLLSGDVENFEVQASTNLVEWLPLASSLVLTNGVLRLLDPGTSNQPTRFYRVLER